jgi:hypothetical protein
MALYQPCLPGDAPLTAELLLEVRATPPDLIARTIKRAPETDGNAPAQALASTWEQRHA